MRYRAYMQKDACFTSFRWIEWSRNLVQRTKPMINHIFRDISFLVQLPPRVQDHLNRAFHKLFPENKRIFLYEHFSSSHECSLVRSNPVIMLCWAPFKKSKCCRECSTSTGLLLCANADLVLKPFPWKYGKGMCPQKHFVPLQIFPYFQDSWDWKSW